MKRLLAAFFVSALALILWTAAASAEAVTGITLPASPLWVTRGTTYQMEATLSPEGAEAPVTWVSSRPQYAAVHKQTGLVTARRMGKTIITAKAGGKSATCVIVVAEPFAKTIKINKTALTLNPGAQYQLVTKLTPAYFFEKPEWSSTDETVATVSETGLVKAVSDGNEARTCVISATLANGRRVRCTVKVVKIPEKYVRTAKSAVVPLYGERPLPAVVYPANAFDRSVIWAVTKNPHVLELVDPLKGVFKGLTNGSALVEVRTANGRSARSLVKVKPVRYTSFAVSPTSKTIEKGSSFVLTVKRKPVYVSYPDVSLSSNDEAVATVELVDGQWVVTAVGRGYAKITATGDNGRLSRSMSVRVISSEETIPVTISAIGDVMLGGDPRKGKPSYSAFKTLWDKHGAPYFFKQIKSGVKGVLVGNLEIPLINTGKVVNSSRTYVFRGLPVYADALTPGNTGATQVVMNLDNNHIMDYAANGFNKTRSALSDRGIKSFGRGYVAYVFQNGIKIGFVGYRPESISLAKMRNHVKAAKKQCDILIASFHWGVNYVNRPTNQQIAYGRGAVNAGADLVLGHHSHVISGIELYKGKHIVYGLGTIVSAVIRPNDIDTFIYRHTFGVTGTSVSNQGFDIVPVLMTNDDKINDAQPVIDKGNRIRDRIKSFSQQLEDHPF